MRTFCERDYITGRSNPLLRDCVVRNCGLVTRLVGCQPQDSRDERREEGWTDEWVDDGWIWMDGRMDR
jgi:hypothetical protein